MNLSRAGVVMIAASVGADPTPAEVQELYLAILTARAVKEGHVNVDRISWLVIRHEGLVNLAVIIALKMHVSCQLQRKRARP